jgi:hypothetical protein
VTDADNALFSEIHNEGERIAAETLLLWERGAEDRACAVLTEFGHRRQGSGMFAVVMFWLKVIVTAAAKLAPPDGGCIGLAVLDADMRMVATGAEVAPDVEWTFRILDAFVHQNVEEVYARFAEIDTPDCPVEKRSACLLALLAAAAGAKHPTVDLTGTPADGFEASP